MTLRGFQVVALGAALILVAATPAVGQSYRTHAQIGQFLLDAQNNYPALAQRYNLGLSVQGRELWAICITDNVGVEEDEPEFKYVSTMHGDEIMGVEMCLNLIDELLTNYGSDAQITSLVDEVEIWIVPLMNPDGYETPGRSRYNANGVDLNRNFPDQYTSPTNTTAGRQLETAVIMDWSFGRSFTLAANYHAGALVANYPYDGNLAGSNVYTPTPDDDVFVSVCEGYSQLNLPMWNSASFFHGITNGADWYVIYGGMQDWSYIYMGCNEITVEVSNTKQPSASQIPTYWSNNRDSMLALMDTSLIGVRGLVTDALTGQPLPATITVAGRNHEVYTDPDVGDYHRMLLPGMYDLTVTPDGAGRPDTQTVAVISGAATRYDVSIWTGAQVSYPNGGEALPVDTELTVTWLGDPAARFQVQQRAYADPLLADEFEGPAFDPEYSSGGNDPWSLTTNGPHGGSTSARAGDITGFGVSWLTRTVPGGALSFWYRVSSEPNFDLFKFYIDGNLEFQDSGTADGWEFYSTTLSAGTHGLKWEYSKDLFVDNGDDTVYIDDLEIIPANSAWADIVAMTGAGETSAPWTPTVPGPGYKVRVRPYYADTGYGDWDDSDASFTVEAVAAGDYDDDGDVDLEDHAAFAVCFGTAPSGPCADAFEFVVDGIIDLDDFDDLAALMGGPQ